MILSGEGANLAMFDGAELARAVAPHPGDMEAALLAYETTLFPRSACEAAAAKEMLDVCLGGDSSRSLVDFFASHQP